MDLSESLCNVFSLVYSIEKMPQENT